MKRHSKDRLGLIKCVLTIAENDTEPKEEKHDRGFFVEAKEIIPKSFTLDSDKVVIFIQIFGPLVSFKYFGRFPTAFWKWGYICYFPLLYPWHLCPGVYSFCLSVRY